MVPSSIAGVVKEIKVKAGDGASPKATDTVTVHYEGTLIDGTVFDSSIKRGSPASFPVNRVIPGWTEALQLMKVGSKWQLFIPARLGYLWRGKGPLVQPEAAIIYEMELLAIKPPATPAFTNQPVTSQIIKVPSKAELDKGAKIEIINPDAATAK
jgi:FKBP-type peptidyl-prolyl cis-trans isomerase FklB